MRNDLLIAISLYKKSKEQLKRMLDSIPLDIYVRIDCDGWMHDYSINDLAPDRTKLTVVYHAQNHGLGWIRNTQLNECTFKWIEFADADDYFEEGTFDKIDDIYRISDHTSKVVVPAWTLTDGGNKIVLNRNIDVARGNGQTYFAIPTLIFDAQYLRDHDLYFDESGKIFEDIMFSIRLTALNPKPLICDWSHYAGNDYPDEGESLSHPEDITPIIESTFYMMDEMRKMTDAPKAMIYIRTIEECVRILRLTDDHNTKMRVLEYMKPYKYF